MAKSVKRSRRSSNNNTRRSSNNNNGRNLNHSRRKSNKGKGRSVKRKKGSKGKGKNSKVQRGGHLASYRFHQNQGFLNRINPNAHSKPLTYFADNVVEDHSNQYSLSH
jgi:hypothetical protein